MRTEFSARFQQVPGSDSVEDVVVRLFVDSVLQWGLRSPDRARVLLGGGTGGPLAAAGGPIPDVHGGGNSRGGVCSPGVAITENS